MGGRTYYVEGDLDNGYDFEYFFRWYKDAEKKYNSIKNVPYKHILMSDPENGDTIIKCEARDEKVC